MIEIKRFKHFEDVLIDVPKDIVKFGEYRKGSDKYGVMISSIMDWLRLHKSKGDTVNRIEVEKNKFFSQTNIKEVDFLSFLKEKISARWRRTFLGLFPIYYHSLKLSGCQTHEAKAKCDRDSQKILF